LCAIITIGKFALWRAEAPLVRLGDLTFKLNMRNNDSPITPPHFLQLVEDGLARPVHFEDRHAEGHAVETGEMS